MSSIPNRHFSRAGSRQINRQECRTSEDDAMKYRHTNLIAKDWKVLAAFYEEVFGCVRAPLETHHTGKWLEEGTGVAGAEITGIHLRLPGHGDNGPTLEIYQYARNEEKPRSAANREGFGHIAFEVEEVLETLDRVQQHGGGAVGEPTSRKIEGVGLLTFVYATDPEGNIIELQSWET